MRLVIQEVFKNLLGIEGLKARYYQLARQTNHRFIKKLAFDHKPAAY